MPHPTQSNLVEYALQMLSEDEAETLHRHLTECSDCARMARELEASGLRAMVPAGVDLQVAAMADPLLENMPCQRMVEAICDQRFDLAPANEQLPRVLGNYRLHRRLGEGGMGVVYQATHLQLQREVAIKLLRLGRLDNQRAIDRFRREMVAAGRLRHPHIVETIDAGEAEGTHYIVMELLEGVDLARLCMVAGPSDADACEMVRQAALGVAAAHQQQLVHRDLKPSNLFLAHKPSDLMANGEDNNEPCGARSAEATVRVLDLGLAMLGSTASITELSLSGQMVGTLAYMAPEQARDSTEVDHRADVYGLGATLYKLLCGLSPFDAASARRSNLGVLAWTRGGAPSLRTRRPDLPRQLTSVVDKALASEPRQRWQSATELARRLVPFTTGADLSALLEQAEVSTTTGGQPAVVYPPQAWLSRSKAAGLGGALVFLLLLIAWWTHEPKPPEAVRFDAARVLPQLNSPYVDEVTALAPDGLYMIVESNRLDGFQRKLFEATRPDIDSVFSTATEGNFAELNPGAFHLPSGVIGPEKLELFHFVSASKTPANTFFQTNRKSLDEKFGEGRRVRTAQIAPPQVGRWTLPQWISRDRLRLYFVFRNNRRASAEIPERAEYLYVIERPDVSAEFGEPTQEPFRALNQEGIRSASLSADELELFFASDREGGAGEGDIWYATREDRSHAFGTPINVRAINTEQIESSPRLLGNTLYFSRGSEQDREVYVAERGNVKALNIEAPKFGKAYPVEELNSPSQDVMTHISSDGLTAVIYSSRADGFRGKLYLASRDSLDTDFQLADVNHPLQEVNESAFSQSSGVIAPNKLQFFYLHANSPWGISSFLRTTREDIAAPFPPGTLVSPASLAPHGIECFHLPTWISHDGLRLYYLFENRATNPEYKGAGTSSWHVVSRTSLDAEFGTPSSAIFREINVAGVGRGSLSADELELFFVRWEMPDRQTTDLWYSRRERISEPFAKPVKINSLNTRELDGSPQVFGDRIYFTRGPTNAAEIFVARRVE